MRLRIEKRQWRGRTAGLLALALCSAGRAFPPARSVSSEILVSANDGKAHRVQGAAVVDGPGTGDSLTVLTVTEGRVAIHGTVTGLSHSLQGPPQAVAITPDGRTAFVGAPTSWDPQRRMEVRGDFIQVVALTSDRPAPPRRIMIGAHPNGLAVSPDGGLLLAACLDGSLRTIRLGDGEPRIGGHVKLSRNRLGSVAITHDGRHALAGLRDDGGVAVLEINGTEIHDTGERLTTGLAPYSIDVSADGRLAVVGSAGLAGLVQAPSFKSAPDDDVVALIDTSRRPFRTLQLLPVPSTPEGVAISPDARWIAVQSMAGSNLPANSAFRRQRGTIVLFRVRDGVATKTDQVPSGEASQGLVFARNSRTLVAQFNAERMLAVFQMHRGKLRDTGQRLPVAGGPASIRAAPR